MPCDEEETRKATIAIAKYKGPAYMRITRENIANITNQKDKFELGKANVLKIGKDISIIACGITVKFALDAQKELKKKGINATVINLHTIKPFDEKTILKYAKKTKK